MNLNRDKIALWDNKTKTRLTFTNLHNGTWKIESVNTYKNFTEIMFDANVKNWIKNLVTCQYFEML